MLAYIYFVALHSFAGSLTMAKDEPPVVVTHSLIKRQKARLPLMHACG
jgi:hypothetical protein